MKKRILLIIALLVGLGVAWLLVRRASSENAKTTPPAPPSAPVSQDRASGKELAQGVHAPATEMPVSRAPVGVSSSDAEGDKRYLDAVGAVLQKPFVFWGKVVDERDTPVAGAKARFSLMNNADPNGTGTRGETESGQDGSFVINGRGMGVYVEVSKDGYYRVPELAGKRGSYGGFRNHQNLGNNEVPIPTEDKPAIFVLRKIGETVPLVHVGQRSIIVPKDGKPTEIDLSTGQVSAGSKGRLRVEVWTQNEGMNPNKGQHYDWRCRLSIVGGGLIERRDAFDFEAPENGYAPAVEFGQAATAERWRQNMANQFFVRFADNLYARINVEMITNGDHFIVLESFLNPTPGSRNLEFDLAKAITPR